MQSRAEKALQKFRRNIVGIGASIETPFGKKTLLYADWTATGRLYGPIEERMVREFGPFIANTHTTATATGRAMTELYAEARTMIKKHVGASKDDVLIPCGSGMTSAVVALQDFLGLRRAHVEGKQEPHLKADLRPIVFVTHMEHHSNHTTWLETICDVEVIRAGSDGLPDLEHLTELLVQYQARPLKIAAVTAASNVTGALVDVHAIARIIHAQGGYCFVDYSAAAPYVRIAMHPRGADASLDAIYFSPHKFLGGAGTPGILIFGKHLYARTVPLRPGGGTVRWTNPWGGRSYYPDIEQREDGGTPPFWGLIKAALAIRLKEEMGVSLITQRERELSTSMFALLGAIEGVRILAPEVHHRLCTFSCTMDDMHYNLVVKLLSDRFGIQARGGCACAGTYGHHLFGVSREISGHITTRIDAGDESLRPGFVRFSLHPTTTDAEVKHIGQALAAIARHGAEWADDYMYDSTTNEFTYKHKQGKRLELHI